VCEIASNMVFDDCTDIEEFDTPHQTVSVYHNPDTTDTCLGLDGTVQICTNYRPHYQEMSIHYAARYVRNTQRVLLVGGGDSMLLYEILQYTSLQLAVGLELDQKIPRTSFQHFGTKPHWDNNKVEWWIGDATKSILMLPKEYFGSFNMAVVDLSETVTFFTVTEELDIVRSLALTRLGSRLRLVPEIASWCQLSGAR